jgi:hypothetical protein
VHPLVRRSNCSYHQNLRPLSLERAVTAGLATAPQLKLSVHPPQYRYGGRAILRDLCGLRVQIKTQRRRERRERTTPKTPPVNSRLHAERPSSGTAG